MRKYFIKFVLILGLTILFFGVIEFILNANDPISQKSRDTQVLLAIVVFTVAVLVFFTEVFITRIVRKRMIRKLHNELSGSEILPDKLSLLIVGKEEYKLVIRAHPTITERNDLIVIYKGDNESVKVNLEKDFKAVENNVFIFKFNGDNIERNKRIVLEKVRVLQTVIQS